MKRLTYLVLAVLLTSVALAATPNPGHDASSVGPGTFSSGDYVFPAKLTTNGDLVIDTSTLYVNSTNNRVGIGTAAPSYTLDVNGAAHVSNISIGSGNERYYPNVITGILDNTATGAWIIHTPIPRASNQMFAIHVRGYAYGASDVIDFTIVGYPYSGTTGSIDGVAGGVTNYDLTDVGTDKYNKYIGVDENGNVAIAFGSNSSSSYFYRLAVDAWITRTSTDYTSGWSINQSTVANFSWKDIKGPLTNDLHVMGNLGVGTYNPAQKLDVAGSIAISGTTVIDGSRNYNGGTGTFSGAVATAGLTSSNGLTVSAGSVSLPASSITSAMIANSAINSSKLSTTNSATNGYYLAYDSTSGGFTWVAPISSSSAGGWTNTTTTTSTTLDVNIDSGTLYVNSSGNYVGIGTATPTEKLEVAGNIKFTSSGSQLRNYLGNNILSDTINNITLGNGQTAYVLMPYGNVGIGTTTPANPLTVNLSSGKYLQLVPTSNYNGYFGIILANAAGTERGALKLNPSTGELVIGGTTGGGYYPTFYSNGTEAMRISTTGNVGIATTSPAYKLDVNGTAGINSTLAVGGAITGYSTLTAAGITSSNGLTISGGTVSVPSNEIDSSEVSFNYAASSSKGGAALTLEREDNRAVSPSELTAGQMKFGFGTWNNNGASPYADTIHLRSYTDATGGSDNLLVIRKTGGIGMRVYQQAWNSTSNYSTFKEVAFHNDSVTFADVTSTSGLTVSGGSVDFPANSVPGDDIADNSIDATEIENNTILAADLLSGNTPSNNQILAYNSSSGGFYWTDAASGTVTGSGTATQIAYWSGASALTGSANLYWDNANTRLGIGTNSPTQALDVRGSANISANIYYGGNLTGTGADFAERLTTTEPVEAGDVVCLTTNNKIEKCTLRGQRTVAGVVSTKPTIIGNGNAENSVPVGIVGIVPTKVLGPIERGDLLTTSKRDGYAETATQRDFGAIVGKAMEPCSDKTCVIDVLVGLR